MYWVKRKGKLTNVIARNNLIIAIRKCINKHVDNYIIVVSWSNIKEHFCGA